MLLRKYRILSQEVERGINCSDERCVAKAIVSNLSCSKGIFTVLLKLFSFSAVEEIYLLYL